jgi:T-complex protein 1 subunit eta
MQPRIVLLKDGVDASQGKGQLLSNINACEAVVSIVRTTLGPRGMDKLIHSPGGVTITNDGATIIDLLDIVHPAAKVLCDIAKSQDDEIGDGTTSVCIMTGELLRNVKNLIEENVHPHVIIDGFRCARDFAMTVLEELHISVDAKDDAKMRELLHRCATTALNSKLICSHRDMFGTMVVDAIMCLDEKKDHRLIGINKVPGGSLTDSFMVPGVCFKKVFAYAGFEQQPKSFTNPKIAILNVELELKAEESNLEIRISDPAQYQAVVDAEWKIIYDKLDKIADSGAQIVLSRLPIGDLATQYFADRNIFCGGRMLGSQLERIALATGAVLQTSLNDLNDDVLGTCGHFEEKQVGGERYNFFTDCPESKAVSIILRGGSEQFIAESERSLHDAIMIVKRTVQTNKILGGAGSIEMELAKRLKAYAQTIPGRLQEVVLAFSKSMEVIPRQLAENAGFDPTTTVNEIKAQHARGVTWAGVDIENEGVFDAMENFVWEPLLVKRNAISAATEAACMILSIDETVKNPKAEDPADKKLAPAPNRGRGMRR